MTKSPTCPECAGTGYVATCPVCRGATTVPDDTLGGASIACEFCDATGQVPSGLATDPGRQPCGHCCDSQASTSLPAGSPQGCRKRQPRKAHA